MKKFEKHPRVGLPLGGTPPISLESKTLPNILRYIEHFFIDLKLAVENIDARLMAVEEMLQQLDEFYHREIPKTRSEEIGDPVGRF